MRTVVRGVFISAVLVFIAQMSLMQVFREPYPALLQPSFGGVQPVSDAAHQTVPFVVTTYDDGTVGTFDHRTIVAEAKIDPGAVFKSSFGQKSERAELPGTVDWLQDRLQVLGGGLCPTEATIEWRRMDIDLDDGQLTRVTLEDTDPIDFGGDCAQ